MAHWAPGVLGGPHSDALDTSSADLRLLCSMLCKVAAWRSDALLERSRHCFNRIVLHAAISAVFFPIADSSTLNCPMSVILVLGFRPSGYRTVRQKPRPCMLAKIRNTMPYVAPLPLQPCVIPLYMGRLCPAFHGSLSQYLFYAAITP